MSHYAKQQREMKRRRKGKMRERRPPHPLLSDTDAFNALVEELVAAGDGGRHYVDVTQQWASAVRGGEPASKTDWIDDFVRNHPF